MVARALAACGAAVWDADAAAKAVYTTDAKLRERMVLRWGNDVGRFNHEGILVDIERLPTSTAFADWERDLLGAIPKFLLNYARYRDWFEAATISDVERMTGRRYETVEAAEEAARRHASRRRCGKSRCGCAHGGPGRDAPATTAR